MADHGVACKKLRSIVKERERKRERMRDEWEVQVQCVVKSLEVFVSTSSMHQCAMLEIHPSFFRITMLSQLFLPFIRLYLFSKPIWSVHAGL